MYVTGKKVPEKNSIQIDFLDGEDGIVVHTCSNQILLPRGAQFIECFETFCMALRAVIGELSFNMI